MSNVFRTIRTAALAALVLGVTVPASAKEKVTFAYLLDPVYESFLWPLKNGKIKSDLIEIEATPMSVPSTIQAMATKQFDVVTTSVFSMPVAMAKGLDMRIMSVAVRYLKDGRGADIWVKADAPYKTVRDLKGKTISITSQVAANTTLVRMVMSKKYGMNVKLEGGDIQWVEIPAGGQPPALATGKVDASTLLHSQALQALATNTFKPVMSAVADIYELYGVESVTAVQVSYPDRLNARPEAFKEFNRMLKASRDYTMANLDEVATAVAGSKMPKTFLAEWLAKIGSFPAAVSEGDAKSIALNWQASKELGLFPSAPDVKDIIWTGAIRTP